MKKAFTLIELLLVMMILGTIIGMVINFQSILDYKKIYAGYQKKATEDVLNVTNTTLLKNQGLRNYNEIANNHSTIKTKFPSCSSAVNCLQYFYSTAIKGKQCDNTDDCKIGTNFSNKVYRDSTSDDVGDAPTLGFRMKNGEVIMLGSSSDSGSCDPCFYIYVDMNGKKAPNKYGQDRYRFKLFKDTIAQDEALDEPYVNTSSLSSEETTIFKTLETNYLNARSKSLSGGKVNTNEQNCINCWEKSPFAKTKLNCIECE